MEGPFLSIDDIDVSRETTLLEREDVRKNKIDFDFPEGFNDIPPIEIARALQCRDWQTNSDSFDMWYDIMKQLLAGRPVKIMFRNSTGIFETADSFILADRYSDMFSVECFAKYPVMINWLVGRVAYLLEKKFPRSLEDIQALKSGNSEPTNMK